VLETAELLISTGLHAAGYEYINLDDCWQESRTIYGHIVEDKKAFPNGIASLAGKIHSMGLKFGLYSDAGVATCQGRPGSLGFEGLDVQSYISWGVDYLKYDNCNDLGLSPKLRYARMNQALNETKANILFSMCEWGRDNPAQWAPLFANSWRTTQDISNNFDSVMLNIHENDAWANYAGPGAWNDPDMLEVGNGRLSYDEEITHFSLWALAKAPLILGNDLAKVSKETLSILTNGEVLGINQDPLGAQGRLLIKNNVANFEIWSAKSRVHAELATSCPARSF
jgi:alpha-galactosidase